MIIVDEHLYYFHTFKILLFQYLKGILSSDSYNYLQLYFIGKLREFYLAKGFQIRQIFNCTMFLRTLRRAGSYFI